MELDDLKNIWQESQVMYQEDLDSKEIESLTQQKSKAISDKLYQNLKFDVMVSCLLILPLLYIIFGTNIQFYHKSIAFLFLVSTSIGIIFYLINQKKYQEFSTKNDLVSTLNFTVKKFEKQIKTITILNNILLLPLMFYGTVVAAEIAKIEIELRELVILPLIISPIAYFYNKYLIKTLYRNHLEKLKSHLSELQIQS
ncbi:hypothetical protein LV89_02986 [Arcicella aurantiaca]|uniref:Uncharacterized protein n=1 Tax=Arcicella aurantiaca TaxID=591202 RepID=A0A316E6Y3_9BACT|nr:hypothetical protein [Arcicella aurantiaca]PWK24473.1 hypothetical protein LV89_02986 [Arcicella aurantiaca]